MSPSPAIGFIRLNLSRAKTALELASEGQLYRDVKDRLRTRYQRRLLARFASRYRLDSTLFRPLRTDPTKTQRIGAYEIQGAGLFFDGQVKALRLTEMGRFGNIVYQLLHACIMARHIGVKTIQVFPFAGGPPIGRYEIDGLTIEVAPTKPATVPTLVGHFWLSCQFPSVLAAYPAAEPVHVVDHVLRPFFARLNTVMPLGADDTIILHFRSGDIFSGPLIVFEYLQPPASFYLRAALHARETHGVTKAILISEDFVNPAIDIVYHELLALGFEAKKQSLSLLDDVGTIINAVHLVAAFGTFCEAIGMLSTTLRSYTAFRQFESIRHQNRIRPSLVMQILRAHQVEMVRIMDPAWDYIWPLTWDRSEQQTNQLCSFPITSLALDYPQDDADDAYFAAYENYDPANWRPP